MSDVPTGYEICTGKPFLQIARRCVQEVSIAANARIARGVLRCLRVLFGCPPGFRVFPDPAPFAPRCLRANSPPIAEQHGYWHGAPSVPQWVPADAANARIAYGRVAQRERRCLTSTRSGVQIPPRPPGQLTAPILGPFLLWLQDLSPVRVQQSSGLLHIEAEITLCRCK